MSKNATDQMTELIVDVQNGKTGAFEELYKATVSTAYNTAYLYLSNHEDISDVIQNSYIQVYKSIKSLRNPESFVSWFSIIVKHECQKHIIRSSKSRNIISDRKSNASDELSSIDFAVDFTERKESLDSIREIVDSLPEEKRVCVLLYYYDRHDVNEISDILDIPVGTVKSRLFSARKKLMKLLEKLREEDSTLFSVPFFFL